MSGGKSETPGYTTPEARQSIGYTEGLCLPPPPKTKGKSALDRIPYQKLSLWLTIYIQDFFPFMKLPGELRMLIYKHALIYDGVIDVWPTRFMCDFEYWDTHVHRKLGRIYRRAICVNLLRANKTINREATPILYKENTFRSKHRFKWMRLTNWLQQIRPDKFAYIRRIYVEYPDDDCTLISRYPLLLQPCVFLNKHVNLGLTCGLGDTLFNAPLERTWSDCEGFQTVCLSLYMNGVLDRIRFCCSEKSEIADHPEEPNLNSYITEERRIHRLPSMSGRHRAPEFAIRSKKYFQPRDGRERKLIVDTITKPGPQS